MKNGSNELRRAIPGRLNQGGGTREVEPGRWNQGGGTSEAEPGAGTLSERPMILTVNRSLFQPLTPLLRVSLASSRVPLLASVVLLI